MEAIQPHNTSLQDISAASSHSNTFQRAYTQGHRCLVAAAPSGQRQAKEDGSGRGPTEALRTCYLCGTLTLTSMETTDPSSTTT